MKVRYSYLPQQFKNAENLWISLKKFVKTGDFTLGKELSIFENKFANLMNCKFAVGVNSGTDAIKLSLVALGIKPGDEIITCANTFVATVGAITEIGAKPVFVDCDDTFCIDVNLIEKKITKKTKALMIPHIYGFPCDMDKIIKLCKKYKLYLIEDAAHSFLAKYKNKFAGTIGDIGVFSFHETKNLVGSQGGAISINNKKFLRRIDNLLDKGTDRSSFLKDYKKQFIREKPRKTKSKKYYSWVDIGSEFRATEIVSALIFSQLKKEKIISKKRRTIWLTYKNFFSKLNNDQISILDNENKDHKNSYHLFILKIKSLIFAQKFREYLQKNKIPATFHYVPLHSSLFGKKFKSGDMKVTNNIWGKIIRLPIYPELSKNQIKFILRKITKFLE